ncbi:ADAMTS-like protein 2 isoform X2 [Carassius auratus]|uniref:ADAMTS-like protein 2 isoform X2 n=1 Tax=Carassius auratus TaxID=7957 RepID=A0A6P6JQW6_CARAU|nr:ADAMTS-like protein 2 isoform X2 [Carassius auratus]
MYCLWTARFGHILLHYFVLHLWINNTAAGANVKDSSEGREDFQRQPDEVAQWWGEWSSWSTCSRTCGGGVRSQERHCLQQRLTSTQNINSSFCAGPSKQYQLCTNQPCPKSRISFKQHQCSQFNAKAFGRKHYEWVPLYPDDYINISNKPCDLQCTTTTGERQLLVPAHDGTFCRDGIYQGVCIEGQCQVVGCDGKLYSSKTIDKCGVCGGNGGSCYRVSGSYRRGITQLGYVFITNIPVGATDIQIIERRKTENILALSDEAGHFFFNGNSMIDNPQNFHVAGTVFKYRRPANLFSDGFEYIMAQGPTHQALNVMYYNLNGKMPHITYEYTVPRAPELRVAPPMVSTPEQPQISNLMSKTAKDPSAAEQKVNASSTELSSTHNEIEARKEYRKKGNQSTSLGPQDNVDVHVGDEELLWELKASVNFSELPGLVLFRPASEVLQNELDDEMHRLEAQGSFGPDSNLIDGDSSSSSDSNHTSPPVLKSLFYDGASWPSGSRQPCKDGSALTGCAVLKLNSSLDNSLTLEIYPGNLDMHSPDEESEFEARTNDSTGHRSNLLQLHQVEPVQTPHRESNEFEVESLDRDISMSDKYRWKVSAYAPCSSTCTTGISTSYALCVKYDGSEVDESYCDALTRPEPTHEFCTGKECLPRWETSRWSECSRTCGEGFQFRTVRCWKMMAPGFDSSVYDELCQAAELQKPITRKACKSKSCGPQWEISDWSECSAWCGGRGVRSREVRCSMEARLCNESTRPDSQRECEGPPCDRRWTISEWGPCSGPCGEGRMRRYVVCKNSSGKVISDGQCDPELKPLAVHPCGDKNCPAHWVEQEWEQCNATCGRGVKTRQVVCAGLEGGVFKEFPERMCDRSLRPADSAACFERPCSKWFTTSWSQCSKTCGIGVRVREVKCYQGEELGHSCDSTLRPEARQSCEVLPCTTEPPAEDDCQDKATANCALVLRVKLCTHWYYRKACCLSCKNKSQ